MSKRLKSLMLLAASALLIAAILAGCGANPTPTATATPTPAPAVTAPAPPPVDKGAILNEAAVAYFSSIPANSNMIDAADVKKKLDAKETGFYLLDIRRTEDFQKSKVEGFVNVPFNTVGANLAQLPRDKQIIVVCYSGQTSGQTVAVLKMAGFNAISVKGGFPTLETAFGLKK